jgi:hypothetical protein
MNWAQSIEQAMEKHNQWHKQVATWSEEVARLRLKGGVAVQSPGFSQLEKKLGNAFELLKKSSGKTIQAAWEFDDLTKQEKAELDGHFQTALRYFKGDKLKAIAAAAVQLQLYKIGDYFSAKETRQLLASHAPVAAQRKRTSTRFKPQWVPLARCAKIVGISRNTIAAWHAQGWQLVQGVTGRTERLVLKRHPVTNQVNLPLVRHIANQKRMMAAPGKPLNRSRGTLAAVQLAAPEGSPQKKEAAAAIRALAAIEKIQSPGLLEEIRGNIKRKLRLRKKQPSKRKNKILLSEAAANVAKLNPALRGYRGLRGI